MHTHTLSHTHKHVFKLSCPTHRLAQYWAQPDRTFLENYNYSFILQRKNWLAIAWGNQYWPPSDTRSRIKERRCYTHTNTPTPTPAVFTTLWDKTTHSKCSFANRYTSSNPRLFCLIWLITVVHRPSPNTLLFLKWTWAQSCFKLLFVNWETNELNCMRVSEA